MKKDALIYASEIKALIQSEIACAQPEQVNAAAHCIMAFLNARILAWTNGEPRPSLDRFISDKRLNDNNSTKPLSGDWLKFYQRIEGVKEDLRALYPPLTKRRSAIR